MQRIRTTAVEQLELVDDDDEDEEDGVDRLAVAVKERLLGGAEGGPEEDVVEEFDPMGPFSPTSWAPGSRG